MMIAILSLPIYSFIYDHDDSKGVYKASWIVFGGLKTGVSSKFETSLL